MDKGLLDTIQKIIKPYLKYYNFSDEEISVISKKLCIDLEIYIHEVITHELQKNQTNS